MIEVEAQNNTDSASRDATIGALASQLGVRAERGRRFAALTRLRVGGAIDGRVREVPGDEGKWSYRHTSLIEGELLLGAAVSLRTDDPEEIRGRMEKAKGQRMETQPHGARSAGCFFKAARASRIGTGKM